jgi:2-polyprenyl-3-methyl-5-hydroxy-6-metoxy-1,4-benzoquinol methylase
MDPRHDAAGHAPASHDDPAETLAFVREQLCEGARLTGSLAATFYRAVHALDPGAAEESLAILPGNRGVHLYDSLVSWASLVAGERVLDIGCGSGGATRSAARAVGPDGLVVGLDICQEAVEYARGKTPEGMQVVYRRCQAERLTAIPDRSFDCVVASLVLDQVTDLTAVIAEAHRALRPGGRMVASVMAFDRLRPMDASFMGAVVAVVGRRTPGALAGRASRASFPDERTDRAAFAEVGMLTPEEQDVQFAAVFEDGEDAWRLFSRTYIAHLLDEEGKAELRKVLDRRTPHTLYLPVRFLRTRRPG